MSTNNTLSTRSTQPEKARLGAVGENMVEIGRAHV